MIPQSEQERIEEQAYDAIPWDKKIHSDPNITTDFEAGYIAGATKEWEAALEREGKFAEWVFMWGWKINIDGMWFCRGRHKKLTTAELFDLFYKTVLNGTARE